MAGTVSPIESVNVRPVTSLTGTTTCCRPRTLLSSTWSSSRSCTYSIVPLRLRRRRSRPASAGKRIGPPPRTRRYLARRSPRQSNTTNAAVIMAPYFHPRSTKKPTVAPREMESSSAPRNATSSRWRPSPNDTVCLTSRCDGSRYVCMAQDQRAHAASLSVRSLRVSVRRYAARKKVPSAWRPSLTRGHGGAHGRGGCPDFVASPSADRHRDARRRAFRS